MALMTTTTVSPKLPLQRNQLLFHQVSRTVQCIAVCNAWESQRLSFSYGRDSRCRPWSVHAVGPGLEASISDQSKNVIRLDNVKIVVESQENDKITVRVDLTGEETQKAFDTVLTNLARTAPPIPGFRKMKGGKTSNVPKSFLLQMLGRDRVTKFLIQEVVSITIGDYVKKENLTVKSEFKTIQTAEELEAAFTPGSEFGFNAVVEVETSDIKTTSST
ncbi:hypothetical protein Cni_G05195 [Canna indica]|uniref:peptidylprolyl isomerase n=1 Tax=Canna indica TaxID=4628 RepID=A0AAQ3Q3I0_9LILI|nr:hypothetical protein Cni_G05195 [Canna indica]